jgi:probable HAF family extracellular repeat protein
MKANKRRRRMKLAHVLTISLVVFTATILCTTNQAMAASFQGLGFLGDGSQSEAFDVSDDGLVVVGFGGAGDKEAFRWTTSEGMVGLGRLQGAAFSIAYSVSSDGSVVVGDSWSGRDEAFRWENGTMQGLGALPDDNYSAAKAVSADGSVVVGSSSSTGEGNEPYRWENGVITSLGDSLIGGSGSAYAISDDGSVVVGGYTASGSSYPEAFRWENGVAIGLGDLDGGPFNSTAVGVSVDGSVIAGHGTSGAWVGEPFRWENGVMTGLGHLPGSGNESSHVYAISGDGSIIVGKRQDGLVEDAFVWDTGHGMRNLQEVLENDYGLDLSGWTLRRALGISNDGMKIVGYGTNPDGYQEAWIAVIPEPSLAILLLGLIGVLRNHN